MKEQINTVIIGGGHAGLTMSYYLSQVGREQVIFELLRAGPAEDAAYLAEQITARS
jgi:glycine/D-amino acid oxidase-like deaminating enzyme